MTLPTWLKPVTVIAAGALAAGGASLSAQCGGASLTQLLTAFGVAAAVSVFHLKVTP